VLITRVFSAVVIVAVTALFVYLGGLPFAAFIVAIAAMAAYEFSRMLSLRGFSPFTWAAVALTVAFVGDAALGYDVWRWAIAGAALLPLFWLVFGKREMPQSLLDWSVTYAGPLYVGVPLSHFVLLRGMNAGQPWGGVAPGLWWVALAILGTWASDTGAYLIGSAFGRRGFMTHISQRKTWEGAIGGTALCIVVVASMGVFILGLAPVLAVVLGVLLGIVAIIGDLAESVLKRGAGVKDSGALIPGHGGMLDRIDSLIFTGVLVYYFALLVQAIGG